MNSIEVAYGLDGNSNYAKSNTYPYDFHISLKKGKHRIAGTASHGEIVGNTKTLNFHIAGE